MDLQEKVFSSKEEMELISKLSIDEYNIAFLNDTVQNIEEYPHIFIEKGILYISEYLLDENSYLLNKFGKEIETIKDEDVSNFYGYKFFKVDLQGIDVFYLIQKCEDMGGNKKKILCIYRIQ